MYAQAREMGADGAATGEELPQYEHKQGGYSVSPKLGCGSRWFRDVRLNAHSDLLHVAQVDKKPTNGHDDIGNGAASGLAANVSRKPSLRQQEKAPEGRPPHAVPDDEGAAAANSDEEIAAAHTGEASAGPAPTESRFQEEL